MVNGSAIMEGNEEEFIYGGEGALAVLDAHLQVQWFAGPGLLQRHPSFFRQRLSQGMQKAMLVDLRAGKQVILPVLDPGEELDHVFRLCCHHPSADGEERFLVRGRDMRERRKKEEERPTNAFLQMFRHHYHMELESAMLSLMEICKQENEEPYKQRHAEAMGHSLLSLFRHTEVIADYFLLLTKQWQGEAEQVYLPILLKGLMDKVTEPLEKRDVSIKLQVKHDPAAWVLADRLLLEKILAHLIGHGLADGTHDACIIISQELTSNEVRITMEKTGVKISSDAMEDLLGLHIGSGLQTEHGSPKDLCMSLIRRGLLRINGGITVFYTAQGKLYYHLRLPLLQATQLDARQLSKSEKERVLYMPFFDAVWAVVADRLPFEYQREAVEAWMAGSEDLWVAENDQKAREEKERYGKKHI